MNTEITGTTTKRTRRRTPDNKTTTGFRVSDELWSVLQPLLPVHVNPHRFGGGRPRVPDRKCADAIFYPLRRGLCTAYRLSVPSDGDFGRLTTTRICVLAPRRMIGSRNGSQRVSSCACGKWVWRSSMRKAPLGGEETGRNPTDRGKRGRNAAC